MTLAVDTSALVAIVLGEPDAEQLASVLAASAGDLVISAASVVEAGIVAEARLGPDGGRDLDELLAVLAVEIVPVDTEAATLARHAWQRFGKGRHPAALNFGDCFSYALAQQRAVPLLFKGDDFAQTDLRRAR